MEHANEIRLVLGIGVLVFVSVNRSAVRRVPAWNLLLTAFGVLLVAWSVAVVEGYFWRELLRVAKHTCYGVSAVLLAVWCWELLVRRREGAGAPGSSD